MKDTWSILSSSSEDATDCLWEEDRDMGQMSYSVRTASIVKNVLVSTISSAEVDKSPFQEGW